MSFVHQTAARKVHIGDKIDFAFLKGQCHEIFCTRFFSSNNSPKAKDPDSRVEAVSHMASYAPRKSIRKSPKLTLRESDFFVEFPFNIYVF
jgi:hypothetical protein